MSARRSVGISSARGASGSLWSGRAVRVTAHLLALVATLLQTACHSGEARADATLVGTCMGTSWKVTVVREGGFELAELETIRAVVQDELDAVDASMSTWIDDSEISRFNVAPAGVDVVVSDPMWDVLDVAADVVSLTEGAFDPTVHPLVRAWGFGGGESTATGPDEEELTELRARVGFELVERAARPALRKARDGVELDLSAVAKGYAVDRVHDALVDGGVDRFLIEVGGELRVLGERPGGGPWRVGVEDPRVADSRVPYAVVEMSDGALATSGDYRNTVTTESGASVGHLFDPREGRPVRSSVASVSVLAPTCARADALATGLSVLGAERARALAEREGTFEVLVLERRGDASSRSASGQSPNAQSPNAQSPNGGALVETQTVGFERCRVERP